MKSLGKVFILGDSYSTFAGVIPEENWPYYGREGLESDVTSPDKTWWYILLNKTNSELLMNDSWSGSAICYTGWDGRNSRPNSFLTRLEKRISNGYFKENKPDTFIIFGGTNDSWSNAPLGEIKYEGLEEEDLYSVLPAFCYALNRLKEILPETRIIVVINHDIKEEIMNGYAVVSEKNGVEYVSLNEIDKTAGHPTVLGMEQIAEQIIEAIA